MKLSDCKMIKPVTCEKFEDLTTMAKRMVDHKVKHLMVVDKDVPVGIVSMSDIVSRAVALGKDNTTKAQDIMTFPIESLDVDSSVENALMVMIQKNVFFMPVTKEGKLVGMLPFTNKLKEHAC
ncbi:MAG: CBS domain-containing protein [Nanoarchaeota archaeon]|nr:CBS domain-containing protein [Nanoarchaeota archaeon]